MTRRHPVVLACGLIFLIAFGWLTLGPQPVGGGGWLSWTLDWFRSDDGTDWMTFLRFEFVENLLLFVPVGLSLVVVTGRRRWWLALAVAIAASGSIEFVQGMTADRVSDPRDIAANSIGAAAGVAAGVILAALARRRRKAIVLRVSPYAGGPTTLALRHAASRRAGPQLAAPQLAVPPRSTADPDVAD